MIENDPDEGKQWSVESIADTPSTATDMSAVPNVAAPFSVKVESVPFRGLPVERDWIPSSNRSTGSSPPKEKEIYSVKAVIHEDVDYRPGKLQMAISVSRRNAIIRVAREIWNSKRKELLEYEKACRIVNTASKEALSEPSEELRRAMAIKEAGPPITKKKAIEEAVRRLRMHKENS